MNNKTPIKYITKYILNDLYFNKYLLDNDIQNDYFKNKNLKDELENSKYDDMSPKEISLLLNVDIGVIKYYKDKNKILKQCIAFLNQ
jgi:hypothetical protein